jgi:extradiol dioxygenase family protein/adenylylsulfate kinase-like enzyme
MSTVHQLVYDSELKDLTLPDSNQRKCGATIWLTGPSSADTAAVGQFLEKELQMQGHSASLLTNGEKIHLLVNSEFDGNNWDEDIRCISFMADTLNQNGVFVIIPEVSLRRAFREEIRRRVSNFIEVYVQPPLTVGQQHTGIDLYPHAKVDPMLDRAMGGYEPPLHAEVKCSGAQDSVAESAGAVLTKLRELGLLAAEVVPSLVPFHLSISVTSLEPTRRFYRDIIGAPERRATRSSAHFDFFGSQLTCHEVPDYSAKTIRREVDAEDVPVPHFGAALPFQEFLNVSDRLVQHGIEFIRKPSLRFINKGHEQHVLFVEDPSGYGIEIKSFTRVPVGEWT